MMNFIFGLLMGGFAVYLWQKKKTKVPTNESLVLPTSDGEPSERTAVQSPGHPEEPHQPVTVVNITGVYGGGLGGSGLPSYQTAPLIDYADEFQKLAEELFQKAIFAAHICIRAEYHWSGPEG